MHARRIWPVIGLLAALTACGDNRAATPTTTAASTSAPSTSAPTTTTPGTTTTGTTAAPTTTTAGTTIPATSTSAPPTTGATTAPTTAPSTSSTTPVKLVDVKVYFLRSERLVIAHRKVPAPAVLRGALTALLAGPTAAERADGLVSTIPAGTTLRSVNLADGLATIDLNSAFDDGGGSLSLFTRLAEVVFTATQFANSDRVVFWMDGRPIEYFGGEGIMLDKPQTRAMVDRSISGSVIIDTPAHGATVTSPFTVTGEGDVYEGEFPIEIWRGGELIGGVAPVRAGAWGTWGEFSVTVTVTAAPGPIELVAYDPGGCGTDPECPPIVKTVVPLTLAG